MKKTVVIIAALLVLVAPAWAQGPPPEGGPEGGPQHKKRLGLTDEQMEKLDAIRLETDKLNIKIRAEVEITERELQHELKQDEIDKAKVDKLVAKLADLHGQMLRTRIDSLLKTKEILTPEQYKKFVDRLHLWKQMKDRGPGGVPGKHRKRK